MQHINKNILVVEDDGALMNILADRLVFLGYNVSKAEDGHKAVDYVLRNKPDLILLDLMVPEVDGFQVLQTVRSHGDPKVSSTPVIILSNLWSDKDILRAKSLRVSEYYVKAHTNLDDVFNKAAEILSKPQS
jgi:DNA-binding response OmpR family regulator